LAKKLASALMVTLSVELKLTYAQTIQLILLVAAIVSGTLHYL